MTPYYEDDGITLYLGDCREIVPRLALLADLIVTDPPYAATSLVWDRWPDGWVDVAAAASSSMWCFGSLRMFVERAADFAGWTLSQDIVWEKHNGSGFHADRFRRIHEQAAHFYRGAWSDCYHATVYVPGATAKTVRSKRRPTHTGSIQRTPYVTRDGGPRMATSVMRVPSMHGTALHPTEKPIALLEPLIQYGARPGALVLDLFAGSGAILDAARRIGCRAIGIEAREEYAEKAARRLRQRTLFQGAIS
jgi:site-specific DNA-methyltransferase (adenine-specific)